MANFGSEFARFLPQIAENISANIRARRQQDQDERDKEKLRGLGADITTLLQQTEGTPGAVPGGVPGAVPGQDVGPTAGVSPELGGRLMESGESTKSLIDIIKALDPSERDFYEDAFRKASNNIVARQETIEQQLPILQEGLRAKFKTFDPSTIDSPTDLRRAGALGQVDLESEQGQALSKVFPNQDTDEKEFRDRVDFYLKQIPKDRVETRGKDTFLVPMSVQERRQLAIHEVMREMGFKGDPAIPPATAPRHIPSLDAPATAGGPTITKGPTQSVIHSQSLPPDGTVGDLQLESQFTEMIGAGYPFDEADMQHPDFPAVYEKWVKDGKPKFNQ